MSTEQELISAWRGGDGPLGSGLREWVEAAQTAWPALHVDAEVFVRYVGERLVSDEAPEVALRGTRAPDLYLACACAVGDEVAIEAFEQSLLSQVPAFLSRLNLSGAAIDEVRQRLRVKLLVAAPRPKIRDYSGRGALGSWLRVVAIRTALDLAERDRRLVALPDEPDGRDMEMGDPEVAYLKALYRGAFEEAYRAAFGSLSGEERNLLRGYFIDGLTVEQLGVLVGVNKSTVSRRLVAARRSVFRETRKRMQAQLDLSPTETSSLIRLIRSQIQLSARSCLGSGTGTAS